MAYNTDYGDTSYLKTQQHAMEMDRLDRANAMKIMDQLMGYGLGGGGAGASTSGYLGLGDAEQRLAALLDNPESIQNTAAYKFRLGQGQQALERSMGAKGLLGSGNRLTELTKYGQDMASQEYGAQFSRLSDLLGRYQTAKSNTLGALAGALSGGALGGGGTGNIWDAYKGAAVKATAPGYSVFTTPWGSLLNR